jgi:hypothetical protein
MESIADYVDADFGEINVRREDCVNVDGKYHIGSSRLSVGYVMTLEKYEEFRAKALSSPLP